MSLYIDTTLIDIYLFFLFIYLLCWHCNDVIGNLHVTTLYASFCCFLRPILLLSLQVYLKRQFFNINPINDPVIHESSHLKFYGLIFRMCTRWLSTASKMQQPFNISNPATAKYNGLDTTSLLCEWHFWIQEAYKTDTLFYNWIDVVLRQHILHVPYLQHRCTQKCCSCYDTQQLIVLLTYKWTSSLISVISIANWSYRM